MDGSGMMLYEHLGQTVAEGKQGSSDGFASFHSMSVLLYSEPFLVAICEFFLQINVLR